MKLCHNQGDFNYEIYVDGETFSISQEGTEVEDTKAEYILLNYGDIFTKFEKKEKKKIKEKEE